jgi:hypothetical protein
MGKTLRFGSRVPATLCTRTTSVVQRRTRAGFDVLADQAYADAWAAIVVDSLQGRMHVPARPTYVTFRKDAPRFGKRGL